MSIDWWSLAFLFLVLTHSPTRASRFRHVSGDFDFDLGPDIDEPVDIEQRRWREIAPERFLPGRSDARTRRLIFAAAGQIPGQANDVFGTGAGLSKQLDDPLQRGADLGGHIRLVVALFVTAGLSGQHDPFAGTVDFDAVRKAAGFRPFGRL